MSKVAFIFPGQGSQSFPGQGSQSVGMCKDLYENYACARRTFEEADEALGFSISKLCFEGPEDQLRLTFNTQPAILTASVACARVAKLQQATAWVNIPHWCRQKHLILQMPYALYAKEASSCRKQFL